jgi:hypothetical protein
MIAICFGLHDYQLDGVCILTEISPQVVGVLAWISHSISVYVCYFEALLKRASG